MKKNSYDNVIITNPEEFENKKEEMRKDGFNRVHVISDFDRTLTHAFINENEFVPSLISVLRDENYLVEGYSEKARALFEYYHPIEADTSISLEERKKALDEWWTKHSKLLIDSGLNKKDLRKVASSERIKLRGKVEDTINLLNQKDVPFVILSSSGIGVESVVYTLEYHGLKKSNVYVISNEYVWDDNGYAIDYVTPHIHTFNKNETSVKNSFVYSEVKERDNVILLGDSLGDPDMAEGFEYKNILKIGFLNWDVDKFLEEYKKFYDVVIINDSSMDFVYDLLKEF